MVRLTILLVVYYLETTFRSQKLTQFVVAKIQQYLREYRDTICGRRLLYFVVNEGYNIQKVAATRTKCPAIATKQRCIIRNNATSDLEMNDIITKYIAYALHISVT